MRRATFLVLALALGLGCAVPPGRLRAQAANAPGAEKAAADPLANLPADLREKVNGIMEKAVDAKRDTFARKMKETIDALVKTTGLTGDEPRKILEAAARDAGEISVRECVALARQRIARSFQRDPQQMTLSINVTVGTGGLAAVRSEGETPPDEQPGWMAAVGRVLDPGQLAAWQAKVAADNDKENQEVDKLLVTQFDQVREQTGTVMRARVAELTTTLDLPPDRAEKLDALGRAAAEQSLKAFRLTSERTLRSILPVEQRARIIASNRGYFIPQGDDAPTNQPVWKAGLAALFTDADRQRLRELQEERQARRARALGRMVLAVLDEAVAFTASQRDRLQEPAERAAQQETSLSPAADAENYFQFPREAFFAAAGRVDEAEVRAVLDPAQWQHWQQACRNATEGKGNPQPFRGLRQFQALPERKPDSSPEPLEPEEIERLVSDGLYKKAGEERRTLLAANLLKSEDATRVAGLDDRLADRLRTAARGTAEGALALWKVNIAQNVRSQLENADPENVRVTLASLLDIQFPSGNPQQDLGPTLWDKTVERELTAPQRAALRRHLEARTAYRDAAVAGFVLAEFDRRYQLTAAQWETIGPLLVTVMREYGPDIHRLFAYSAGSMPWYFQTGTMWLPLLGIPEDDLTTALGKERWERWAASPEQTNAANYWRNVRQFHLQRKKETDQ